jgi:hypothetical protein
MPHDQRDAALARLRELIRTGDLELDRFTELADEISAARTGDELRAVLAALPPPVRMSPPERRLSQPLVLTTLTGKLTMAGHWQVARETKVSTTTGRVFLDFREAEFDSTEIELELKTSTGRITVVVPPAVDVQFTGIAGAVENFLGNRAPVPGGVLLRVRASAVTGKIVLLPPQPRPRVKRRWWRRR